MCCSGSMVSHVLVVADRFSERYAGRSTSEPVFPAALMLAKPPAVSIVGETVTWHCPTSLRELLSLKAKHPEARIVAGNTEVMEELVGENLLGFSYRFA